jgi:glucose-fructose oxidoreductase
MTSDGPMSIEPVVHQAKHMDAFTRNILDDTPVIASGEMGKRDMYYIEKIYASAESGGDVLSLAGAPEVQHLL